MRIALISDIHSNLHSLNLALNDAKEENVDAYYFLGDYVSDGMNDNAIVSLIKDIADMAIIGNREKNLLNNFYSADFLNQKPLYTSQKLLSQDSLDFLKTLDTHKSLTINSKKILIIHGDGIRFITSQSHHVYKAYDTLIDTYDFDICIFGHTHVSKDTVYRGKRFINPGSIGIPNDSPSYKYAILDTSHNDFKLIQRSFDTHITFESFVKDYTSTSYYKENPLWGSLILDAIRLGNNPHQKFFAILDHELKDSSSSYNQSWERAFKIYQSKLK